MDWYHRKAQRTPGKSLPQTGFADKYAVIFRAVDASVSTINSMDYITMSRKWAIGHADHQQAVTDAPQVVLRAMVLASLVFEAGNPGEYFYNGQPVQGRVIYQTAREEERPPGPTSQPRTPPSPSIP